MTRLTMTDEAVERLVADVALWGTRNAETGGFLLAAEDQPDRIGLFALAGDRGIQRRRGLFTVSGAAIERLFSWAGESDLRIRAQVHSHARGAFLSPTDLRHGFDVDGFITSVIPDFARPSRRPDDWGWWHRGTGAWHQRPAPDVVAGHVQVVRFDERGVHAA